MGKYILKFIGTKFIVLGIVGHTFLYHGTALGFNSGMDLTFGGSARTYPAGGIIELETGFYSILWGIGPSGESENQDPWYGYTRVFFGGGGAGEYSEILAGVEVFPVSFFGVRVKTVQFANHADYEDFDCVDTGLCRGTFRDARVEGILKLGYGQIFFLGSAAKIESEARRLAAGSYIHPGLGLRLSRDGINEITEMRAVLGYKVTEQYFVSVVATRDELDQCGDTDFCGDDSKDELSSNVMTVNVHYRANHVHLFLGAGQYWSDIKDREATVVGGFSWSIFPGPGL